MRTIKPVADLKSPVDVIELGSLIGPKSQSGNFPQLRVSAIITRYGGKAKLTINTGIDGEDKQGFSADPALLKAIRIATEQLRSGDSRNIPDIELSTWTGRMGDDIQTKVHAYTMRIDADDSGVYYEFHRKADTLVLRYSVGDYGSTVRLVNRLTGEPISSRESSINIAVSFWERMLDSLTSHTAMFNYESRFSMVGNATPSTQSNQLEHMPF